MKLHMQWPPASPLQQPTCLDRVQGHHWTLTSPTHDWDITLGGVSFDVWWQCVVCSASAVVAPNGQDQGAYPEIRADLLSLP